MDIVERLRDAEKYDVWDEELYTEAAYEIERLREEVSDLKDLMQSTVNYTGISVSTEKYAFHAMTKKDEAND